MQIALHRVNSINSQIPQQENASTLMDLTVEIIIDRRRRSVET